MRKVMVGFMLASMGFAAAAQETYPVRPISMIVPFPPGGVADITGRPTAAALEKILKQPVTINNRPGAGGKVGNAAVANAKPDGYTIMMALSSVSVLPEADRLFDQKPAYTLDQLAPIALISADPVILVVHPSLPVKTLPEMVTLARQNRDSRPLRPTRDNASMSKYLKGAGKRARGRRRHGASRHEFRRVSGAVPQAR